MRRATVLLGVLLLATAAAADEPAPVLPLPTTPGGWLERIGTPARPEAVASAVAQVRADGPDEAILLTTALGHAGGHAALEGLAVLAGHPDVLVRRAALEVAGQVGLRSERMRQQAVRSADAVDEGERHLAIEALAHLGDGRDVPRLLDLAAAEDRRERSRAFRALVTLTGASVPYTHARWSWWWKSSARRAGEEVPAAFDALEADPTNVDAPFQVETLLHLGWVDLPATERRLRGWLIATDDRLRTLACRVAGALRLGDLATEIERTLAFGTEEDLVAACREALEALGVPSQAPPTDAARGD